MRAPCAPPSPSPSSVSLVPVMSVSQSGSGGGEGGDKQAAARQRYVVRRVRRRQAGLLLQPPRRLCPAPAPLPRCRLCPVPRCGQPSPLCEAATAPAARPGRWPPPRPSSVLGPPVRSARARSLTCSNRRRRGRVLTFGGSATARPRR